MSPSKAKGRFLTAVQEKIDCVHLQLRTDVFIAAYERWAP